MNFAFARHSGHYFGRLLPLLLVCLVVWLVWQNQREQQLGHSELQLTCPAPEKSCGLNINGRAISVTLIGARKPLQRFRIQVDAPHARKVEARFTMEDMDMGFNLYTLRASQTGRFATDVTLPVCVTGRRDWVLHLSVDQDRLAIPFVTEL